MLAEARVDDPPLTVQLVAVERLAGEAVTVTFALVNRDQSRPAAAGHAFAAAEADAESMADTYLLDEAGRKKYFVLRDGQGRPSCTTPIGPIPPGERRTVWVRFPAPPLDVKAITVQVPRAAPFRHVPLADAARRN